MGTREIEHILVKMNQSGKVLEVKPNSMVYPGDIIKLDFTSNNPSFTVNGSELTYTRLNFSIDVSGTARSPNVVFKLIFSAREQIFDLKQGKFVPVETGEGNGEITYRIPPPSEELIANISTTNPKNLYYPLSVGNSHDRLHWF